MRNMFNRRMPVVVTAALQAGFRRSQDSQRRGPPAADVGDAGLTATGATKPDSALDPALDIHPLAPAATERSGVTRFHKNAPS